MTQDENMASAVGAKTARACDICVRRRARWYCAPDDAFLCQSCDDSVHSANPLARRHERVRLKTASSPTATAASCLPTWHRSPTKKPRTPRHRKKSPTRNHHHQLLVPELDTSTSMEDEDEDEEQLLYRVPVYEYDQYTSGAADLGSGISHGFLPPSDFDMAEFAADVEALLGKGLDGDHACGIEELGLLINPHERHDSSAIKIEMEENKEQELGEMEVIREPFELSFDYDSPVEFKVVVEPKEEEEEKKMMLLRLDYDAISSSWGTQGSPWMNGKRPDDDFWPISALGDCGGDVQGNGEQLGSTMGGHLAARGDEGREARVSRYREKRRTRLFSKKIRYEVRRLNAEKRPRMKGRFVKRSSFS